MPKIDLPVKRLVQRRSSDWVKFLQPGCQKEWIKPFKSEYTPKTQSRLDEVFAVEDPKGAYLVNFEPMGYYDLILPVRMMRYRSDIWEATLHAGQGTPPLLQAVFFFYPEHDNKNHRLTDHWEELKTLEFTYRVVRVWEESRQSVIERELVGLYPLLPLMKEKEGEEAKQVLQESITVVSKIKDEALRQDLLAVMGILAGGKYAAEVVYSMIRREMVMQSPVYQEWAKEERIEGRIEGRIEKAREDICKFMVRRFGADPDEITQKIGQISSLEILDKLMEELFAANTKEEAQNIIGNGTARLS
ncbi:hypothetical protein HY00_09690 [Peptococcaceae bacterium SCADC1_2_3]|jgi:predicted transposase YdaD|nr:hypothetical protein HY00_09690 [Peptococcaceae bacterium SCADC1_2_3]